MATWQETQRGTGECRGGEIAVTRFRWRVCCGPSPAVQRSNDKPKEIIDAAKRYEERRDPAVRVPVGAPKGKLWCPINKHYYTAQFMKAAHVVPASLGPELADRIFGGNDSGRASSVLITV